MVESCSQRCSRVQVSSFAYVPSRDVGDLADVLYFSSGGSRFTAGNSSRLQRLVVGRSLVRATWTSGYGAVFPTYSIQLLFMANEWQNGFSLAEQNDHD